MKKTFTKITLAVLSFAMFTSTIPLTVFPGFQQPQAAQAVDDPFLLVGEEVGKLLGSVDKKTSKISRSCNLQTIGTVASLSIGILQLFDVVPNRRAALYKGLMTEIYKIEAQLLLINNKLDQMMNFLDNKFREIGLEFAKQTILNDINIIKSYDLHLLDNYLTQLNTTMNSKYVAYTKSETYPYRDLVVSADYLFKNADPDYTIKIYKEDIKSAVQNAGKLDIDNPSEWFLSVFGDVYDNYLGNEKYISSGLAGLYSTVSEYGVGESTFKELFCEGVFNYIVINDFFASICQDSTGSSTYVAGLINTFNHQCDLLNSPTSPFVAQFDIIKNAFGFQADTYYIDEEGNKKNYILESGKAYITTIVQLALFTLTAAKFSGLVQNSVIDQIVKTCRTTTDNIMSQMKSYYKVDLAGKPYDSYSYKLGCPIKVDELTYKGSYSMEYVNVKVDNNLKPTEIIGNKIDMHFYYTDLPKFYAPKGTYLSSDELKYLNATSTYFLGSPSFRTYLENATGHKITRGAITNNKNWRDADWVKDADFIKKDIVMNTYQFINPTGYLYKNNNGYQPYQVKLNDMGYNHPKLKADSFWDQKELIGSYYNLDTGKSAEETTLFALSAFNEDYKYFDEIGYLWYDGINGPSFYNPERKTGIFDRDTGYNNILLYQDNMVTIYDHYYHRDGNTAHIDYLINFHYAASCLIKLPNAAYGVWSPEESEIRKSQYFTNDEINEINGIIDKMNIKLSQDKQLLPFEGESNDANYWIQFDKALNDLEREEVIKYASSEDNLIALNETYKSLVPVFNDVNERLTDEPAYPEYSKTAVKLDVPQSDIDIIIEKMHELIDSGEYKEEFIFPGADSTDLELLGNLRIQLGEELYIENGEVKSKYIPTMILDGILTYTRNHDESTRYFATLPCGAVSDTSLRNLTNVFNLPVSSSFINHNAVKFAFNEDVSDYMFNTTLHDVFIHEVNGLACASVKVVRFGAFSICNSYLNEDIEGFTLINGVNPTCVTSGYANAYVKNDNLLYYSDPANEILIGDGSYEAYQLWISEGHEGYLEATGEHHCTYTYDFDDATNKFNFHISCDDCSYTNEITVDGKYIEDTEATCISNSYGHYIAFAKDEDDALELAGSTEANTKELLDSMKDHNLQHHDAKENSCTEEGNIEHWECLDCGGLFLDEEGKIPAGPEEIFIAPEGHNMLHHERIEPDVDKEGKIEYWECLNCGKLFTDEHGLEEITEDLLAIPATNHILEHVEQVDPTCLPGCKEYWYCEHCDKYFETDDGKKEIGDFEEWSSEGGAGYLEPHDHIMSSKVYYTVDGNMVTATIHCSNPDCDHVETATMKAEIKVDTAATCTRNALGHYEAEFADHRFGTYVGPMNSVEIPNTAHGHSLGEPEYSWNGNMCTATVECEYCDKKYTETQLGVFVVDTPATCTSNAKGHYEVTFYNGLFSKQVTAPNSVELPNSKLEHQYGSVTYTWNGSLCTATAYCMHEGCTHCISETVQANLVIDSAATCTKNAFGHYEAIFSNPLFIKQSGAARSVELMNTATGHHYGEVTYSWNGNQCTATTRCTHNDCDEVITETVTATLVTDTPATCTRNALGHYEATFTNGRFKKQSTAQNSVELPNTATGHSYGEVTYTWNGDKCIARCSCTHDGCNEFIYEVGFATIVIDTAATTESNAKGHYKVVFANPLFTAQETAANSLDIEGTKLVKPTAGGCAGCSGSITGTSIILSLLALAGISIIILRKKKHI